MHITKIIDRYNNSTNVQYGSDSLPTSITMQDGRLLSLQYNTDGRLEKLIDNNPNEIRYYGILAEFYEIIGEPDKAIILYEKITSKR